MLQVGVQRLEVLISGRTLHVSRWVQSLAERIKRKREMELKKKKKTNRKAVAIGNSSLAL